MCNCSSAEQARGFNIFEKRMSSLGKYDEKGMQDVKAWIDGREKEIQKTKTSEAKYSAELEKALTEYHDLEARAESLDPEKLQAARLSLRPEEEKRAVSALENAYGASYDPAATRDAKNKVADQRNSGGCFRLFPFLQFKSAIHLQSIYPGILPFMRVMRFR